MTKIIIIFNIFMIIGSCAKNKALDSYIPTNVGTDSTLDIVTWNIENFPKNNFTIDYLVEIIDSIDVDIIAMQEIGNEEDFANLVHKLDGWEGRKISNGYGLAYLYKSELIINNIDKIEELNNYNLSRTPYMLELNWKEQIIYIINNHYKCCGNNIIENDHNDEEFRRKQACILSKNYIDSHLSDKNVILLGDLNDDLADPDSSNVFINFINDKENYLFVDQEIAFGSSANWSYPSWPSHLDHILITDELFDEFENYGSNVKTILIEEYFEGGWNIYDNLVSDHRPVCLSLNFNP